MRNKAAIAKGSTSGIGLAVAHELAKQGCNILLNGFGDPAQIDAIVQDMQNQHAVSVSYHGADMSKPDEIKDLVETCQTQFGSAFVAAKHGVLGLTKVIALETAETPITCNAICPGWVRTALVQKQIDAFADREGVSEDEAIARMLGEKQPSKTFILSSQLGQAVVYLCSEAASEIRGSTINIDGGWLAQ